MEFHLYKWISLPLLCLHRVSGSPIPCRPLPALHVSLWPTMVPSLFCSLRVWARGGGGHFLGMFQRRDAIWGCPRQRKAQCHLGGRRWPPSRLACEEGGNGHTCYKQLMTINSGSRESDAGENFTGLSAKTTWISFCSVGETQNPLGI